MKLNLWQAITIAIVAVTVLLGVQVAVINTPVSQIPPELQSAWATIQFIFTGATATIVFAFLRNVLGYLENKAEATAAGKQIQYESTQLAATLARFTVYVGSIEAIFTTVFVNTPFQQYAALIAGAIGVVFDITIKAVNDLASGKVQVGVPSVAPVPAVAPSAPSTEPSKIPTPTFPQGLVATYDEPRLGGQWQIFIVGARLEIRVPTDKVAVIGIGSESIGDVSGYPINYMDWVKLAKPEIDRLVANALTPKDTKLEQPTG